jgi:hypothetical protein
MASGVPKLHLMSALAVVTEAMGTGEKSMESLRIETTNWR